MSYMLERNMKEALILFIQDKMEALFENCVEELKKYLDSSDLDNTEWNIIHSLMKYLSVEIQDVITDF